MHCLDRTSSAVWISLTQAMGILVAACGSQAAPPPNAAPPRDAVQVVADGPTVPFDYTALDGTPLSTRSLAGRISVIGFATTYDPASQVQARFLTVLLRRHRPRINVALLVLEPPENKILVETFAKSLGLPYPVALADAATIAGQGPFTGLHHVPSVVVLDADGREAFRYLGLLDDTSLDKAVRAVEALRKARR